MEGGKSLSVFPMPISPRREFWKNETFIFSDLRMSELCFCLLKQHTDTNLEVI